MKIKTGDKVIVVCGKYKGTVGGVVSVFRTEGKVVVEGVNLRTMHMKPKAQGEKGSIIKKEGKIDISNVAFYDEKKKKGTKIGYTIEKGKKSRIGKLSNIKI